MVTPQDSRRILAPGDKLGKHEVIRQIAVGGVAELYLTRTVGREGLERLVCVKRLLPQHSEHARLVDSFLNEARLAATLRHPNIAQVYEIGEDDGECFFSMEYVHGEDLGRLVAAGVENGVPISIDCALTIAVGLCAGLHHAHEKLGPDGRPLGVVHRDVSPSNVLVSYDGAVKLVDFGIARASGAPASLPAGAKSKLAYTSPEQCNGRMVDRRSDVFCVGTILYELTTGQLPFTADTEYELVQHIAHRDPVPPSHIVPGYAPALEAIVMKALSRAPERRYATAHELLRAIEGFARDSKVQLSALVLARVMSTMFPARLEEWDTARKQGAFFVEQHVVQTLIEDGKTPEPSPRYVPQPLAQFDDGGSAVRGSTGEWQGGVADGRDLRIAAAWQRSGDGDPQALLAGVKGLAPSDDLSLAVAPAELEPVPQFGKGTPAKRTSKLPGVRASVPAIESGLGWAPAIAHAPSKPSAGALLAQQARRSSPELRVGGAGGGASSAPRRPSAPPSVVAASSGQGPPTLRGPAVGGTIQSSSSPPTPPSSSPLASGSLPPDAPFVPPGSATMPGIAAQPAPTRASQMPVPNMPGAVPIVMPPIVPSGGTLVSSATLAGNLPPTAPLSGGLVGRAAQMQSFGNARPPGYGQGVLPPHPMTLPGVVAPTAAVDFGPMQPADMAPTAPVRPMLRQRARWPLALAALVGISGAAAGAWLVVGRQGTQTSTAQEPAMSAPVSNRPHKAAAEDPADGEAQTPTAAAKIEVPEAAKAEEKAPDVKAAAAPAANPAPEAVAPEAVAPEAVAPEAVAPPAAVAPEAAAAPAAAARVEDPRPPEEPKPAAIAPARIAEPKPARFKPAPKKPKRAAPSRPRKSEAKEQPWNDDSPFMPVTQKR